MKRRVLEYGFLLVLALMIVSAYCNTFFSPPYLDDFHSFINTDHVYLKDFSPESLISLAKTPFGWTRWVPILTFALNHKLGGSKLVIFHATNLAIHLLVMLGVLLLALQVFRLSKDRRPDDDGRTAFWTAFFVACLWALNPVQTSAVTYLVQRMASLQALFYVASVAFFLKGRIVRLAAGTTTLRSRLFYWMSFLAGVCSFFSKENAVTLPLMLVISEIWFFQPDFLPRFWQRLRQTTRAKKLCLAAFLTGAGGFAVFAFLHIISQYNLRHFTLTERLMTQARVVVWYISLLFWPAPSRLSMEHDVVVSTSLLSPPTTLAAILFLAALLWLAIHFRHRFQVITYGIVWFLLNLSVESTFVPLELVFEHRLYLPSVGFFIALVAAVGLLFRLAVPKARPRERLLAMGSIVMIVASVLTFATFERNEAWESTMSLHQDAARKAPNHPRAQANLANAYFMAKEYDKAIEAAEKSIALSLPRFESHAVAANAILISLVRSGDLQKATERTEELLQSRPKEFDADVMPMIYTNLGEAYRRRGKPAKAMETASQALYWAQRLNSRTLDKVRVAAVFIAVLKDAKAKGSDLDEDGIKVQTDLLPETWTARAFYGYGDADIAKKLIAVALEEHPGDAETLKLSEEIRTDEQLSEEQKGKWSFTAKYVRHPFSRFNFSMAIAFIIQEKQMPMTIMKLGEAFLDYALELQPDSTDAHLLKGWYYYQRDDAQNAVAEARLALKHDPENGKAWLGLGFFLIKAEQKEDAAAALRKSLALYPRYSKRFVVRDIADNLLKKESLEEGVDSGPGTAAMTGEVSQGVRAD
ncbi:MAG TPA: tetratricopeptide repeat protein [Syntrophobacter fumaroxidans]|nr:tetratricopeptide repeat protein [Syntrophobacter fumaroxidans]